MSIRKIVFSGLFLIVCSREVLVAQVDTNLDAVSAGDSMRVFRFPPQESLATKLEHAGYVCGATLAFSLFDYIGYNLVRGENGAPFSYRILQSLVQAAITYFLYEKCGINSAVSFNLIWWTWGSDIAYYGWADALNPKWARDNRTNNGLQGKEITWAWWTPIGLLRKKDSPIARNALIAQATVGFAISVAIF